jgi:hypothetical protein
MAPTISISTQIFSFSAETALSRAASSPTRNPSRRWHSDEAQTRTTRRSARASRVAEYRTQRRRLTAFASTARAHRRASSPARHDRS